ncbi:cytochrome c biogenesis protein ResB [Aquitalea magnusonii]|uniref:cytochrome c biogenesis protein ResB n=1 Tax=Aquitalea magnusonii TaxID=332411 RepID=UPI0009EA4555|nr:cytochrome c biogenesis protein ResB [Aquitalea magnusonii]
MTKNSRNTTLYKLYELFSSMRFAIGLLTILAIASIIGTVLKQNEPYPNYAFEFGQYWFAVFEQLGLYDVYHSGWFLTILAFLVLSTTLCILRNGPGFIKDMKAYREKASDNSLAAIRHSVELPADKVDPDALRAYLRGQGWRWREHQREDGNVKRVLTRCFGIAGFPGEKAVEKQLWALAEALLPADGSQMTAYTQGLMDLGATVCGRKPACTVCPMVDGCVAAQQGRTHELPTPRPKKAVPTRHTVMLLAQHGERIWLERRPPSGIWGGLLSLPEFADSMALERWLECMGQGDVLPSWPELEHVFTHYRLIITPVPARLDTLAATGVQESAGQWIPLQQALEAGLPAPVKRLLQRLLA